jgi:SAM-dependent methyltransferase
VFAENVVEAGAMALTDQALLETRDAFDGVAHDYDRSNTGNPILRAMRTRALAAVRRHVPAGSTLIDLGCGPGTDTAALVAAGYHVTAIDWAPAMADQARRHAAAAGLDVDVRQLGIHQLDQLAPRVFDAAYSNFGPLNCVPDLEDAARQIGRRLRPGGVLVASVIGRVCPWELALFGMRGDRARARVRLSADAVAVPLSGRNVWTRYWSPAAFTAVFRAAGFRPQLLRALGLFAPPPYLEGVAGRHPRLVNALQTIDDCCGGWPLLRNYGDHFLIALRRA